MGIAYSWQSPNGWYSWQNANGFAIKHRQHRTKVSLIPYLRTLQVHMKGYEVHMKGYEKDTQETHLTAHG